MYRELSLLWDFNFIVLIHNTETKDLMEIALMEIAGSFGIEKKLRKKRINKNCKAILLEIRISE